MFDTKRAGHISAEDLHEVLDPLTDSRASRAEWKKVLMEVDGNGDGLISYEEFKSLMQEVIMGNAEKGHDMHLEDFK